MVMIENVYINNCLILAGDIRNITHTEMAIYIISPTLINQFTSISWIK